KRPRKAAAARRSPAPSPAKSASSESLSRRAAPFIACCTSGRPAEIAHRLFGPRAKSHAIARRSGAVDLADVRPTMGGPTGGAPMQLTSRLALGTAGAAVAGAVILAAWGGSGTTHTAAPAAATSATTAPTPTEPPSSGPAVTT